MDVSPSAQHELYAQPPVPSASQPGDVPEHPEIAAARRAMEVMGEEPKYTLDELAEKTGLDRDKIEDYWLWLGIPVNIVRGPLFTDPDIKSLKELARFVEDEHLSDRTVASLVRAVGHSADLMASWQFEALVENTVQRLDISDAEARRMVIKHFPQMAVDLDNLAKNAYRIAATRVLQRNAEAEIAQTKSESDANNTSKPMAVGFADIVGFTRRTATMEPAQLKTYIHNYESRARDIVTRSGGRVVKTVGDAVLFLAESLDVGMDIAMKLADSEPNTKNETPMRVGVVWGQVVQRFGDVFGTRVNLAARLAAKAAPNTLLVDRNTAAFLATDNRYELTVMPETQIQGLGEMRPVQVSLRDSELPVPPVP